MCDVTMPGRGPTPDSARKWGLPPEKRLGRNSPLPLPAFPPHSSCFCQRVGQGLDPRPSNPPNPPPTTTRPHALDTAAEWLGLCAVTEPFRIGFLLMYSIPECEWVEPRSGPNSISSPLAPWLHLPIYLRLHPSLLAIKGVTKWQSENSLTLLKKEEGVHCPHLPHLPSL